MFLGRRTRMHARYAKAPKKGKATFEPEHQMVKKSIGISDDGQ